MRTYTINADVRIIANLHQLQVGIVEQPEILDTRKTSAQACGLIGVTVTNSVHSPFGRFSLQFAPNAVTTTGKMWSEVVAPYSLVQISMHRYGASAWGASPGLTVDGCTKEPVPMMVGIVDLPALSEDYSGAQPMRHNTITGRCVSAALVDSHFYTSLNLAPIEGLNRVPQDLRKYYQKPSAGGEPFGPTTGWFAVAPNLLKSLFGKHPVDVMDFIFRFAVQGLREEEAGGVAVQQPDEGAFPGESDTTTTEAIPVAPRRIRKSYPRTPPFIRMEWADETRLSERLTFDRESALSSTVDSSAYIPPELLMSDHLHNTSWWQFLAKYSDQYTQELFSETAGATLEGASVRVVSRKKPFAGFIDSSSGAHEVGFHGGSRPKLYGQSLFDKQHGNEWGDRDGENCVYVDGSHLIGRPRLQRGGGEIYSGYSVRPMFGRPAAMGGDTFYNSIIPVLIDAFSDSPSHISLVGARMLDHQIGYIPVVTQDLNDSRQDDLVIRHACCYELLLREWHYRTPAQWSGQYTVMGRTDLRAGMRLFDVDQGREYYVTEVQHAMQLGPTPSYITQATVERGWDVPRGTR